LSTNQDQQIKHLGVDAGGTFTDFVVVEDSGQMRTHKVLSTPDNPANAILQGITELGLNTYLSNNTLKIVHGSTVATNAALEGKGARTAYVANKGFADVLSIGRQNRKELYNLKPVKTAPPVPRDLCFELNCRRDAQGNEVQALDHNELTSLIEQLTNENVEAVAINLLFSFLNDQEERHIEEALNKHFFVSRSSYVLPVYKEYERGIATWLNASLEPRVSSYLKSLKEQLKGCDVSIMQSSGGLLTLDEARKRAVNLLLSGPAGGLSAVQLLGRQIDRPKILSFDMGGTSTDVSLMNEHFTLSSDNRIADWPVAIPMLEMDTIGAGGGSIAWIDEAGMLHVGPESAGSTPGPACYGRGGQRATVTDANLILGHVPRHAKLGGSLSLDFKAAQDAVNVLALRLGLSLEETAAGIIQLAEQQMSAALHNISVKQGHSPKDFTLCCFGGAGGMHVCALAEQLEMKEAIIPQNAGVLSAFGMLTSPPMRTSTKSHITPFDAINEEDFDQLYERMMVEIEQDSAELVRTGNVTKSLDLRYLGQSYTIEVPYSDNASKNFEEEHEKRFGHALNKPVELVNLKLSITGQAAIQSLTQHKPSADTTMGANLNKENALSSSDFKTYDRHNLTIKSIVHGPAIITEATSTTWLPKGWHCQPDMFGNLRLKRENDV